MATVFLAADLRHGRPVALKVLPPELALAVRAERFHREIAIAARLGHPNILPLLDSGDAAGLLYYVMPYVQGESLRQRITRERQLPLNDILRMTREMADALDHAHGQNVIHRDIKPENVLLQAGHAVLTDFGIARAIGAAAVETVTTSSVIIGTPAYMSPEHAAGEAELDKRSDVYSLGCVVYEMMAGHPPFGGATVRETIARHAIDPLPSIRAARDSVSLGAEEAVRQALAKEPADRFPTAGQFAAALAVGGATHESRRRPLARSVAGFVAVAAVLLAGGYALGVGRWGRSPGPPGSDRPMLAVLPFVNLGPPGDEYFADGVTEEITMRLAGLSGLGVISRTSATQYKNTTKSLKEIGRELGADYVLEGTIRWQKGADQHNRVLITPQLIRVRDDTHVWAQRYDSTLSEVFALQSAIANGVAAALDIALLEPERLRLEARPTSNLEAYDSFLRGNDAFARGMGKADVELAVRMYERATTIDPGFALAWAMQSRSHAEMFWSRYDATGERLARAKAAAEHARRLAPHLAESHLAQGYYYYYADLDYERALQEFSAAALAAPSNGDIAEAIGYIRRRQGRWAEAVSSLAKAVTLDPRSYTKVYWLAQANLWIRDYREAERWLDRAIMLGPDQSDPYIAQAMLYLGLGDSSRAGAAMDLAVTRVKAAMLVRTGLLISGGLPARVFAPRFDALLKQLSPGSFGTEPEVYFLATAMVSGALGRHARAVAYYDSARATLEPKARARPKDYYYHMLLALAFAGLGWGEAAAPERRAAVELLPSKDTPNQTNLLVWLAEIDVMADDYPAAIEGLKAVLSLPHWVSSKALRLDPIWAPLRGKAAFDSIVGPV